MTTISGAAHRAPREVGNWLDASSSAQAQQSAFLVKEETGAEEVNHQAHKVPLADLTMPAVTICVPTYKRPQGLAKLLEHIEKLDYAAAVRVIVVDNDGGDQAGFLFVQEKERAYRFQLIGFVEATRGQTYAYNRAFQEACLATDATPYIAVLDDDEYPDPDWLKRMMQTALAFDADIVGGPVLPVFDEPDHWLRSSGLYEPKRFKTGPVPLIFGAGSMLIKRSVMMHYLDEPFPNDYAFTGGSDLDFFSRCRKDGCRFAWANEALVYETIPVTRVSVPWILRRSFRAGTDLARVGRKYDEGFGSLIKRLIKGPGLVGIGLGQLSYAWLLGKKHRLKALMTIARGLGRISGEFNVLYEEYRHTHGT